MSLDILTVIAGSGATKQLSWITPARFAPLVMTIVYIIRAIGIIRLVAAANPFRCATDSRGIGFEP